MGETRRRMDRRPYPDPQDVKVGARLRALREDLGYSQNDLVRLVRADGVTISQSFVSRLEKGDLRHLGVGIQRARAIERNLNVKEGELFG
jgi:transcriptional regulator with XRE-family HTH domain